jgi:hypothetical protein
MNTLTVQNKTLQLDFDRLTGALIGIHARELSWPILTPPHPGLSFRLLVPLSEDRRNNPVYGEKQALTRLETSPEGDRAVFTWDNVISEVGGTLSVKVNLEVTLTGQQAIFTTTIENRSAYVVENVYCPYLGDVQHPPHTEWFKTFLYTYNTANEWSLWPTFQNLRGYYGVDYPTQYHPSAPFVGAPMTPFILLRSEKLGLYVGVNTPSSELVTWHTELRPGYSSSIDGRVPGGTPLSGDVLDPEAATRFAAVHLPYIQPGETRTLTPIAIEPYRGGWQAGCDIYKQWRTTWMKPSQAPQWATQPHAWQQIHINSPEDELRVSFRDLPKVGAECARHGVKAIQLVGWNDGGQDQGNPSHDPDPRLGTFAELKQAIAECQAQGVKIILFSKFTWSDRATERFRRDLIRLAIKDPYGDYYLHPGYQYQTATQLLDINTKRLIPMCFLSEEYLRVCDMEFKKTLELGADGILFDECLHHGPALLCFDPDHGHRYGAPVYANDRKLIQNFSQLTQPVKPDFLFAGEGCYDWEMGVYHLSYHRSESKEHIPLSRYLLPEGLFMTAVTGFNDRNMINQCLLYKYIISYEPYNFKGHLDDYPLTIAYGKKMDALRTELRDYFWDGEFRHEVGATVTVGGKPNHPYAVYVSRQTGKNAVAVANYDEQKTIVVQVSLDDGQVLNRYRLVDTPEWQPAATGIILPPFSAACITE